MKHIITETEKDYVHVVNSFTEFMQLTEKPKLTLLSGNQSHDDDPRSWSGTKTYDEALQYLTKGWPEGMNKVREIQRALPKDIFDSVVPAQDHKSELQHRIAGGIIDMGAYMSGATPDVFLAEHREVDDAIITSGNKLKSLYVNVANSCGMSEEAFLYRGAYVYLLIEHLEQCGYSCEVWTVNCIKGSCGGNTEAKQRYYVKIKEYGEMFDSNKLCVCLAAPFFLRRFIFCLQEQLTEKEMDIFNIRISYGVAWEPTLDEEMILKDDADNSPLCVRTVNQSNKDTMLHIFKQVLRRSIRGEQDEDEDKD